MKKAHVQLWMHEEDLLGVIVLMPSGVVFSNQTGGTACMHPDAEGVFLPLVFAYGNTPKDLEDRWYPHWDNYDQNKVAEWIEELELHQLLEPVPGHDMRHPMLAELQGWGEAWLPVMIKKPTDPTVNEEVLKDFVGHYAILTYSNSD